MAQLIIRAAGAAIGWAIGGPTGAQIGWAIGGALSPQKTLHAPDQPLMDLKVTGSEYGQPIPYVRGAAGIAGQMWWNTDRRPTTTTTSSGGGKGGGGGVESSVTTYDMDCLIGLTDNEIVGVARIWNNGKLIYTADSGADAGSIEASADTTVWTRLTVYTGSATQLPDPTYEAAVTTALAPAYRGRSYAFIEGLRLGQSGQVPNLTFEVVTDGSTGTTGTRVDPPFITFDPSAKNSNITLSNGNLTASSNLAGAHAAVRATEAKSSSKWYCEIKLDAASGVQELFGIARMDMSLADGQGVGGPDGKSIGYLDANGGVFVSNTGVVTYAAWGVGNIISILLDADINTLILWKDGVVQGTWPHPFTGSYTIAVSMVIGGIATANFGASAFAYTPPAGYHGWGTLLKDITITPPTVADVVSGLCLRAGLTAGQFDVTGLSGITRDMLSLALSQIAPTRSALELLMSAYFFEMVVSDKIYFRTRGGSSVASIPYLDLGATKDDKQPEPLALRQSNDLEIPAQIALSYINVDDDYQIDTQYSDRLITAAGGTVSPVQMALGLTPSDAKQVADTMLLDQAASAVTTKLSLLGNYCRLEPTDAVTVTGADGSTFRLRLVQKNDAYPLLEFDAVLDDATVLTSQGITSADYTPSTVVAAVAATLLKLLDIPIAQDADNDAGFYVAAKGDATPYPGAAIFSSADNVEFTRRTTIAESAVFGTCTTTLGAWSGGRLFDEANSVTVNVGSGTLASSTHDALLAGLGVNSVLIGSELLQFRVATLVSPGVYKLTGLLRGARGTEWAMTGHAASERCVLIRSAGLRRIVLENSELGVSRYYKGVTLGEALASATAESFTDNAIGLKPFAPIDLRAARDGSNNITFTWQRRTRLAVRMIGALGISVPLGEDSEAWELDIYANGSYATVVRTISASSATAAYSAAEQTADGLTPGNTVYTKLYQRSAAIGRGYALQTAA